MNIKLETSSAMDSPWKDAKLIVNGYEVLWGANIVLLRGQENELTVEASPIIARQLQLGLAEDSGLNIVASPNFNDWVDSIDGRFKWKLTPQEGISGRITLVFLSREVEQVWVQESLVLSPRLADEVDVEIVNGKVFFRGQPKVIRLTPKPDSPIAGHLMRLTRTVSEPLQHNDLSSSPRFDPYTPTDEWSVTGANRSGRFELHVDAQGVTTGITLTANTLLSINLADEARVLLGGVEIPTSGVDFVGGEPKTLTLSYKNGDLLKGVPLALDWIPGPGLLPGDIISQPSLNQLTISHQWTFTPTSLRAGDFRLKLYTEGEGGGWTSPNNRLKPDFSSVTIYFVQILGSPAPLPPETFRVRRFSPIAPSVQVSFAPFPNVTPVPGVSVEMIIPEFNNFTGSTGANGKCVAYPVTYPTVGTREITATVTLPDNTKRTAKVLIEVYIQEGETE